MESADPLLRLARHAEEEDKIVLDFKNVHTTFPNASVRAAAAIDYMRNSGVKINVINMHRNQERVHINNPLQITELSRGETHLTNSVWRYENEVDAHRITQLYMDALIDNIACQDGVIDTLNWCIYEVLDNVFQHSQAPCGYVMMQFHRKERYCVISVMDNGLGIHQSLARASNSDPIDRSRIATPDGAIDYALEKGVTSKGRANQGNGLHGLRQAVEMNGGSLSIRSGFGQWTRKPGGEFFADTDRSRPILGTSLGYGTCVDWRLDCSKSVNINDAIGRPTIDSPILDPIQKDAGYYQLNAREFEEYLGSRNEGAKVRNRIINYLSLGAPQIVITYKSVGVISSSFADEVHGKLAAQMGIENYRKQVFIEDVSNTNHQLIQRAIELRTSTEDPKR